MAPNPNKGNQVVGHIPPTLPSDEGVEGTGTISDIRLVVKKEEVEEAKCECCGMREECSEEYRKGVRDKFWGKYICGLCGEAVKEEMNKNGGKGEEALEEHMSGCVRFNRIGRSYPVLYQAEAMKQILRKSSSRSRARSADHKIAQNKGAIARTSSCIPEITPNEVP